MKVKVLMNLGTNDYGANVLPQGEHEVTESFGRLMVSRGHAVEIPEEPKPEPKPQVSVKAEAPQGEVVAAPSPVVVAAAKPDNFQKTRAENDSPKTKK